MMTYRAPRQDDRLRRAVTPQGNTNVVQQQGIGEQLAPLFKQAGLTPQSLKNLTWQQAQTLLQQRGGPLQVPGYQGVPNAASLLQQAMQQYSSPGQAVGLAELPPLQPNPGPAPLSRQLGRLGG